MENEIKNCRICNSNKLQDFLQLGSQALTGIFPQSKHEVETYGELTLTKCEECDLVQLRHTFPMTLMYGDNYGYRSGLNQSMVTHLKNSVEKIKSYVQLNEGDLVIDIGSNDGTLLGFYPQDMNLKLLGVDPVGKKFKQYYLPTVNLIPEFFPSPLIQQQYGDAKAKIITSFSCFYDLEDPIQFSKDIVSRLSDDGVWVFEQSYLPMMVQTLSYDTICHEHLEYYCLKQIKFITDAAGLKIVDVIFNDVNGGSFCIVVAKNNSKIPANEKLVSEIIEKEKNDGYGDINFFKKFAADVQEHKKALIQFFDNLKKDGKKIAALGASTKGNVVLQYCHLDTDYLMAVGEVNEFKFSRFTPGTKIPIISEAELSAMRPDYKVVLPWHFRKGFIEREKQYIEGGGKLIFALPKIEVYPG